MRISVRNITSLLGQGEGTQPSRRTAALPRCQGDDGRVKTHSTTSSSFSPHSDLNPRRVLNFSDRKGFSLLFNFMHKTTTTRSTPQKAFAMRRRHPEACDCFSLLWQHINVSSAGDVRACVRACQTPLSVVSVWPCALLLPHEPSSYALQGDTLVNRL